MKMKVDSRGDRERRRKREKNEVKRDEMRTRWNERRRK